MLLLLFNPCWRIGDEATRRPLPSFNSLCVNHGLYPPYTQCTLAVFKCVASQQCHDKPIHTAWLHAAQNTLLPLEINVYHRQNNFCIPCIQKYIIKPQLIHNLQERFHTAFMNVKRQQVSHHSIGLRIFSICGFYVSFPFCLYSTANNQVCESMNIVQGTVRLELHVKFHCGIEGNCNKNRMQTECAVLQHCWSMCAPPNPIYCTTSSICSTTVVPHIQNLQVCTGPYCCLQTLHLGFIQNLTFINTGLRIPVFLKTAFFLILHQRNLKPLTGMVIS